MEIFTESIIDNTTNHKYSAQIVMVKLTALCTNIRQVKA